MERTSTLFSGMKVKVINLDRRPDRWKRFSKQAGVFQLGQVYPIERFSAVDGKTIDVETDDRISMRTKRNIKFRTRRTHEDIDTVGAIGCYLSHVTIWKEFLASNASAIMVLEDDAMIPADFVDRFHTVSKRLSEIGDFRSCVWSLSGPHAFFERDTNTYIEGSWIRNVATPTTGYILFRDAAKQLLSVAFPIDNHVDLMTYQATQLDLISTIHAADLILKQVPVTKHDTNIQENSCVICNIPTNPGSKGYLILSPTKQQQLLVGFITMGILIGAYAILK
jgi:GR25 family glycosyltransferase involved in LPS biosynthesis